MLNARETSSEPENVSGKSTEKSNFAQTCSLLRQYLKQKSFSGYPSFEVTQILQSKAPPIPMNSRATDEGAGINVVSPSNLKPINLFPQSAGVRCSYPGDISVDRESHFSFPPADARNRARAASPEMAPMTIFYDGGMVVRDDFPEDKARVIMALVCKRRLEKKPSQAASDLVALSLGHLGATQDGGEGLQPRAADKFDMPIARRNSLHRFLAKRKDRSAARAPYQVAMNSNALDNALSDMEAQLSEHHLELRL